ncbi:MAG TPA: hypothetical protein VF602_04845 [Pedobacter sp.]
MKKYLLLPVLVVLFVINACQKDDKNDTPALIPEITIDKVTYSSFSNSTWNHVAGGMASIKIDLLNAGGGITSSTLDSVDLKNIPSYKKVLEKGRYDVTLASKNGSRLADTFVMFNAKLEALSVENKQAVSFTATTTNGLITIAKSLIKDNTVPVFKADTDGKEYKLGFINGFYYLYTKDGVKGTLSFSSKTTGQNIHKGLSIAGQNHYNLGLVTANGSLEVVFAPFAYLDEAISASTLITITNADIYYDWYYKSIYFIATDANGKILNEVKYISGTKTLKLSSLEPYDQERLNFYMVGIPKDLTTVPQIFGYLQVKKGSIFGNLGSSLPLKSPNFGLKIHLKNASAFDKLHVAADVSSSTLNSLADSSLLKDFIYSDNSKIYVQKIKNNQVYYNFFNIGKGIKDFEIDLNTVTKSALVKTITLTNNQMLNVNVHGRIDKNFNMQHFLGSKRGQGEVDFYYPDGIFEEYHTSVGYSLGSLSYIIAHTGTSIPTKFDPYETAFNVTGATLANFSFSTSGAFDFYKATFTNDAPMTLAVTLISPSAANHNNIKLPNFAKYVDGMTIDLNTLKIRWFGLHQVDGFEEKNLAYNTWNFSLSSRLNAKAVEKYF